MSKESDLQSRLFGYISSLLSKVQTIFFPPQCYCENAILLMFGKRFPVLSVSYVDSYIKRKQVPEETVVSFPNSFPEFVKQKLGIAWRRNVFGILQGQFLTV